jgi:hypothetical protein
MPADMQELHIAELSMEDAISVSSVVAIPDREGLTSESYRPVQRPTY